MPGERLREYRRSTGRGAAGAALNRYGNANHERESCKYRRGGRTWRASRRSHVRDRAFMWRRRSGVRV